MAVEKTKIEESSTKVAGSGKRIGGRKKGTPNRKTVAIEAKLKKLGCDPLEGMAKIAKRAMDKGDLPLAGNMYKELAQYIAPKRKALEHTGANGTPIQTDSSFNFIPVGADC